MRFFYFCYLRITRFKKYRCGKNKYGSVNQKSYVECNSCINPIKFYGLPDARICLFYFPCLHQCRMQVQIMWHYRSANYSNTNIQCFIIWKCGYKPRKYFRDHGLRHKHLYKEAGKNNGNQ